MYKIIITDVDGTLLNSEKKITNKTKLALIKAQEKGVKLVLASGRPTSALTNIARELNMDKYNGILISFNGAKVTELKTNNILYNKTISISDSKSVLEHLKNFDVIPMIDKGNYLYINNVFKNIYIDNSTFNVIEYESRSGNFNLCEIEDLSSFVDFPLNKILISGNPEYLKKHHKDIMYPFLDRLNCMFTSHFYLEFTKKNIDKLRAIIDVILPLGFNKEDIISFGDGENDLSMIEFAGLGVAMGNSVETVKNKADYITSSNNEDGIAVALDKYLFC